MKEEEGEDPIQEGLMMIYVDDALILSVEGVVSGLIERLGKIWELSKPDWLGDREPVRFLGMDLWKRKEGGFFVSQEAYIKDLLQRRGEERGPLSGLPITRDQAQRRAPKDCSNGSRSEECPEGHRRSHVATYS